MPSIITASQLRDVLGVSSSLYSDAYLDGVIDSAELTILPLLDAYANSISSYRVENGSCIMTTQMPNLFVEGQSVVISGVAAAFNGTQTITDTLSRYFQFSFDTNEANIDPQPVIPAGKIYVTGKNASTLYAATPNVEKAITIVSVEIFQSVTAAGGQIEGVDFQPAPFRMGRSLLNRVIGLLSPNLDVETMAQ